MLTVSQIVPSPSPRYNFDPNATYVIGGGLGGLGQTLVDWMVGRKARHFILLSRSGAANNGAAKEMISRHAANGVEINAPSCDVADENAVRSVFEGLSQTMPPIKGCIQGSMVLRVSGILLDIHFHLLTLSTGRTSQLNERCGLEYCSSSQDTWDIEPCRPPPAGYGLLCITFVHQCHLGFSLPGELFCS